MQREKFTVILLYPDYLANDFGQDVYVANVEAECAISAIHAAQAECFQASLEDDRDCPVIKSPEDMACVVVLPGYHSPCLFGWQL